MWRTASTRNWNVCSVISYGEVQYQEVKIGRGLREV
jgi:hypothetical protein